MKKYRFEILVFVCGAISMGLELVAARVFSPYLGSSNLVWTTIIGMILVFMSLGYFVGGKKADNGADILMLKMLLISSSIYISIIPILEIYVLYPFASIGLNYAVAAIFMAIILFGFPSFTLAFISPFSVKVKVKEIDDKEKIGQISGKMSALSTIGSIVGTFITGFVLIPNIGVSGIILLMSILLFVLTFLLEDKYTFKIIIMYIVLIGLVFGLKIVGKELFKYNFPGILKDVNSEYSRIQVINVETVNGDKVKGITVGNSGMESLKYNSTGKIGGYNYYYDLPHYYLKDYKDILLIGGAGYTYPTFFYGIDENKDKRMDVVEIDPTMTELAVSDFDLDLSNPNLKAIHQDGRTYINYTDKKYDAVLIDAFKGDVAPFELTTYEACRNIYNILNDNGMIITNVISSFEGKYSDFLKYEYSTYKAVFDDVKVFAVNPNIDKYERQNIILVGIKGNLNIDETKFEEYKKLLDSEIMDYFSDKKIVTDDFAPIGH